MRHVSNSYIKTSRRFRLYYYTCSLFRPDAQTSNRRQHNMYQSTCIQNRRCVYSQHHQIRTNLIADQRQALKAFEKNTEFDIKPADKVETIVI